MPSLLLTNGTIYDPAAALPRDADLLINDGKIAAVGTDLGPADETIDAAGKWVTPGLIDIHVHFREPGDEAEETIATGSAAAVAGGFTTVCVMPNTRPPLDDEASIEFVLRESARVNLANVLPVGCLTKNREGRELAEIGGMWKRGAVAFSDDGSGVSDANVMRKALQYCNMFDAPIMQHCEEPSLSGGCMNAGDVATELGLPGIPSEAEELMIARDVLLNRRVGCRYHVQHISSVASVELIRIAKAQGLPVTAEASPHHLLLTDESCPRLRRELQDEPAAADPRGRERGDSRRGRRHDRLPRHRSRPAFGGGKRPCRCRRPPSASSASSARSASTKEPSSTPATSTR